jgi:hypothetical protein
MLIKLLTLVVGGLVPAALPLTAYSDATMLTSHIDMLTHFFDLSNFSVLAEQTYDATFDPVLRQGGPEEGPKHGYFAVPLIVIGLAALLIFFSRNE